MEKQSLFVECENAIEKLRKNREKIPQDILKTRYATAYRKLLADIQDMVQELIKRICIQSLPFHAKDIEEKEQFLKAIQELIEADISGEILTKIGHAIFKEYNLTKALEIAELISNRICKDIYGNYWLSNCHEHDGKIHNDLIDMDWDDENGLWVNSDVGSVSLMLPPSKAMIDNEFQSII